MGIDVVNRHIMACSKCPLHVPRKHMVGFGDANAPIMIVGDHPTPEDHQAGIIFGDNEAGHVFMSIAVELSLLRIVSKNPFVVADSRIYVTNAVKCPSSDKNLTTEECRACTPWLGKEIAVVKPKIIVAMGNVAMSALTGKPLSKCRITKLRGLMHKKHHPLLGDFFLLFTWNPLYILKRKKQSAQLREQLKSDLEKARDVVERLVTKRT